MGLGLLTGYIGTVLVLSTRPSKKGRTIEPFSNLSVVPSVISGVVQFMVAIIRKGNREAC
jgi:hypothetical protein